MALVGLGPLTVLGYGAYVAEWVAALPHFGMVWIIGVLLLLLLQAFVLYWVGDAARYLSPSPSNIALRQQIRAEGLRLLRHLHRSREYARIVIVGHSLGSVIGYDPVSYTHLPLPTSAREQISVVPGTLKKQKQST